MTSVSADNEAAHSAVKKGGTTACRPLRDDKPFLRVSKVSIESEWKIEDFLIRRRCERAHDRVTKSRGARAVRSTGLHESRLHIESEWKIEDFLIRRRCERGLHIRNHTGKEDNYEGISKELQSKRHRRQIV